MKKAFLLIAILYAGQSFAQKGSKITLAKGQKVTVNFTTTGDTDMGMGMQMKNTSSMTSVLDVLSEDDKNYSVANTVTKLKIAIEMMGQQTTYDSDKPEDKNSDMGKELSSKLNVPDTSLVDRFTGKVTKKNASPERTEDESSPLAGMLGSMSGDVQGDAILAGAFFLIPQGKKIGDSWIDSSTIKNVTSVKNYFLKSIDKNIALIVVKTNANGEGVTEMQGSSVTYSMATKSNGEMTVDIKTGLVNKNTSDIEISGTLDVMGQSMPITSKTNSTLTYQY
jgi:hypothetical protein